MRCAVKVATQQYTMSYSTNGHVAYQQYSISHVIYRISIVSPRREILLYHLHRASLLPAFVLCV
jgi:hypothetical protein